jgi:hypothetical protein
MKYWEIIADNLKKAGWSYGYVSALDREGRTIWIADAHRDGKRFVVRADEKLTPCGAGIGNSRGPIRESGIKITRTHLGYGESGTFYRSAERAVFPQ